MIDFNLIKNFTLKLIFGNKKRSVGILNEGKNNTFVNNTFEGFDVGIKDKGENTKANNNKFYK